MLQKTRGIVFRFTKYGDTSIIVTIFTETFGLQSYIVNGVRSKSGKNKIALYQPMTLLDMVVYHKENASILRIKEAGCAYHYQTLATDIRKSAIILFLNEVLNKAVKEQSHTEELFSFLFGSLEVLDKREAGFENFHLIFLIRLTRYLGFEPQQPSELTGAWLPDDREDALIRILIASDYETTISMTNEQRRDIMDVVLRFYRTHIENFGEVRSSLVLREVLE